MLVRAGLRWGTLGEGDYLVEGVKFQMSGWWEMRFEINANGVSDEVIFNIVLP